jgi:hypothetical protein
MKKTLFLRFLINSMIYLVIALAIYYLYSPLNHHPDNRTRSAVQFVYQQF